MRSSVLLLGGFGTIGARLAARIATADRHSLVLSSRTHRDAPHWAPRARTCVIDVTDERDWSHHLDGIDTIVHLVSLTDFQAKDDPELAWRVGVDGTRRLLGYAIRRRVRRIVFLSTGHVYGTPYTGHITELTSPRPQQPYAETHLAAEKILSEAHEAGSISAIRLRLSNGFGYPMIRDNAIWQIVINDLCRQAIVSQSLTLKSPGLQQRNFIPFSDVCTAVIHSIDLPEARVGNGLFNLGSSESMRVIDVARRVQARASSVLGFEPALHVPDEKMSEHEADLHYDSSKLRDTGLQLTDDLDAEIDSLLRYCVDAFGGTR